MKRLRAVTAALLVLICITAMLPGAAAAGEGREATILFTHDLHSHFLPQSDGAGNESGGYARLMTVLTEERRIHPDAITVDGGDFSIGSLIQTLYTTQAAELRTMGAMGYDAATVGNHEFDHGGVGFAQMLTAAVASGEALPALVMANYKPSPDNPDQLDIQRSMAAYGVQDYMLLERGGVTYGIFGLVGEDSHDCAPASGFVLGDAAENAQRCVDALEEQGAEFIICLSHSGTNGNVKKSEDEQLAKEVEGIDLIVSGHTHTTLTEPIQVEETYIVSAGPYCQNLGSVTFRLDDAGEKELVDYHLTAIDESIPEDRDISLLVEDWKRQVGGTYLARYGFGYDEVLTTAGFSLPAPVSGVQTGNALGELVADAYLWAVENLEAESPDTATVTVTAAGVLRAPLYAGDITVSQAFDVLSMGVGTDGTSGYPLVSCYLTGKELKALAELDASVTPLMPTAQLYMSGMTYSFNTNRMFFNRVYEVLLNEAPFVSGFQGSGLAEIENDQLYRMVSGMYSAQMLGTVKEKSFGLLSIVPKDENGQPITDFSTRVLRDKNGNEVKEWYALAAYLESFGEEGLPDTYSHSDGRKDVSRSLNPIELLKNPNWLTLAALLVVILLVALVVFLVRRFVFRRRRRYRGW